MVISNDAPTTNGTNGVHANGDAGPTDWNKGEHSALVSIGTHKLHLNVAGPDRKPGDAVVVVNYSLGGTVLEWAAALREMTPYARVVTWDRAGFGQSETSPNEPTAENHISELRALLDAAGIPPPYVLVGHSWGGCLSMEFASRAPADVAGAVFVDCGPPHYFDEVPMGLIEPNMVACAEGVDFVGVTGLGANAAMTGEELGAMGAEKTSEAHEAQAGKEFGHFLPSYEPLKQRNILFRGKKGPLLGDKPVAVVKGNMAQDYERVFRAGVEQGNGTEEQRAAVEKILARYPERDIELQTELFKFSNNGRFFQCTEKTGHFVPITEPEFIGKATRWTMDHLVKQ